VGRRERALRRRPGHPDAAQRLVPGLRARLPGRRVAGGARRRPGVAQYVNENGADVPGPRQDALLALALAINAEGGHIDGVGLQAHVYDLDTDRIDGEDLTRSIDRFAEAGLRVRISENDVTRSEGPDAQAEQYAEVFAACFRHRNCVSYTT
jgi:endo-1,4-beta-xylanase